MLARVPRVPAKVLGVLAAIGLLAHGAWLGEFPWHGRESALELLATLAILLVTALVGRIVLALLPPGEVGSHAPRSLGRTLATSLVLGRLALAATSEESSWVRGVTLGVALVAVLGLTRWITLPGAMVPRHRVEPEPRMSFEGLLVLVCVGWGALLLACEAPGEALAWFALGVCAFHALGVARRARLGRYAVLVLGGLCAASVPAGAGLPPTLGLGLGACSLVPWLRRADRRAGALAALGFGSLFLVGPDPLALAAALVFVLASHARQRRFALTAILVVGALALARAWLSPVPWKYPPEFLANHRDIVWGWILDSALERDVWGLAWPLIGAALVLGFLTFPWRGPRWIPGTIDEPRREVVALTALIALSGVGLSLPYSNWFEREALQILFPLCALLAGLLLIPPERVPARD